MKIYQESILKNNLSVITIEDKNSETVAATMWISAGSRYENPNEYGLAHVLEHVLLKETRKHSLDQIGTLVDRKGAYLNAYTSVESISVRVQSSKNHSEEMLNILAEIITQPLFNTQTIEKEKNIILEELASFKDSKNKRIGSELMRLVFDKHPLSQTPIGTETCIKNITATQLQKYYNAYITPNRSVFIVSGNITHEEVVRFAQKNFTEDWNNAADGVKNDFETPPPQKRSEKIFIEETGNQTRLFFNFLCPNVGLEELVILELIANSIGYGKVPILKEELRHKEGLIYTIGVAISKFRDASLLHISTATTKPKEVLEGIGNVLSKIGTLYEDEQKLIDFKEQFKEVLLRKFTNQSQEMELLWILKKLTGKMIQPQEIMEIIDSVKNDDIQKTIEKFLSSENLLIIAFGEKNPFE